MLRGRAEVLPLVAALLLTLTGCDGSGDDAAPTTTRPTSASTTTTTGSAGGTTTSIDEPSDIVEVRSYFLRGEKVGPVARAATDAGVGMWALHGLLAGPTSTEQALGFSSAVPAGTLLLGLSIEDGIATVNLTEQFTAGGGSASITARVAQVVFTVTQFPTVEGVLFEVEGAPLTTVGGEGLVLDRPQTRADWESFAPAILVETPLPFGEVTSPVRISGTANTFEAAFHVTIIDGDGTVLYDQPAMATSGSGTRGTFDVSADVDVSEDGEGTLKVFELWAENGQPVNVVEIPVNLR